MKKNVIVSLADSNYFNLLNELIDSIKQFEFLTSKFLLTLLGEQYILAQDGQRDSHFKQL